MDIVVFYDDCFAKEFKNMSTTRVREIMSTVQKSFSENGTLGTTIEFQDDFPIIPHLQSRWCEEDWSDIVKPSGEIGILADGSTFDANGYVFLTNGPGQDGHLGIALHGGACNPKKRNRISIAADGDKSMNITLVIQKLT